MEFIQAIGSKQDLIDIKIEKIGHQLKILKEIQRLPKDDLCGMDNMVDAVDEFDPPLQGITPGKNVHCESVENGSDQNKVSITLNDNEEIMKEEHEGSLHIERRLTNGAEEGS